MFTFGFDMRSATFGAPAPERYRAARELTAYAESHGLSGCVVGEHHGSGDGYLPSPLVLASALASVTSRIPISVSALILPLWDPVRLAEEMCVLDILSEGRVSYTAAVGYMPEEYDMFGVEFRRRGRLADEKLNLMLKAKTGEPFERDGKTFQVDPAPFTPGGPVVRWGGGSIAAARRAGRFGLDMRAQGGNAEVLTEAYLAAAAESGVQPGTCSVPNAETAVICLVADDVDEAWAVAGRHLLHHARAYAEFNSSSSTALHSSATTVDELRGEVGAYRIYSVDEAIERVQAGANLFTSPLIGGLPVDAAWKFVRCLTERVMPAIA